MYSSPRRKAAHPSKALIAELDQAAGGALGASGGSGELTGKIAGDDLAAFCARSGCAAGVAGGRGKTREIWQRGVARLASRRGALFEGALGEAIALLGAGGNRDAAAAEAVTEGLLLGNFDGDKYRTDKKNGPVESAVLVGFASGAQKLASIAGASSVNRRISRGNSATSLRTC